MTARTTTTAAPTPSQTSLERLQRLIPASTACSSMRRSSSALNSRWSTAARLSSSCGPRTHRPAPRSPARRAAPRPAPSRPATDRAAWPCRSAPGRGRASHRSAGRARTTRLREARESAGTPSRYRSVSMPCASGENAMQPTPSSPRVSSSPSSIQRFSIEYDGWWISSGVPRSAQDLRRLARCAPGSTRRSRRTAPGPSVTAVWSAPMVSSSGVSGSSTVRVEDVDVVQAHPGQRLRPARPAGTCGSPSSAVRPRPHVVPGLGGDDQLVPVRPEVLGAGAGRSWSPPSRRAGRSCWPGRSG